MKKAGREPSRRGGWCVSVVGWEQRRDSAAVSVFDEPECLGLSRTREDLEVVEPAVFIGQVPEPVEALDDDGFTVERDGRRRGDERLARRREEHAAGRLGIE